MSGRVNLERENSMKNTDFTSRDHSTFNLLWDLEDILRSSTTETWSSRPRMVKRDKSGGSINNHSPSRPRSTTNHGTFRAMVVVRRWKFKAPTHNGGRSSNTEENSSSTSRTVKLLMLKEEKMLKLNQLLLTRLITEETRNGKLSMLRMLKSLKLRE
jgi:hypothetical protein